MTRRQLLAALSNWIAANFARNPPSVGESERFRHFGLDARAVNELAIHIEQLIGRRLSPALIWRYPTLESLVANLLDEPAQAVPHESEMLCLAAGSVDELRSRAEEVSNAIESGCPWTTFCGVPEPSLRRPEHRLALAARSPTEALARLRDFLDGRRHADLASARLDVGSAPCIAFIFSGHGAQWFGMARNLLSEPIFYTAIEQCDHWIQTFLGWRLIELLAHETEPSKLDRVDVSLPAIVAIEIAVAAQWAAWGVRPNVVLGHSIGEVAAAHVAGALSLEDAMRTICVYGRILARVNRRPVGTGLVDLPWDAANTELRAYAGELFCAIENSVDTTIVTGDLSALERLFAALRSRNIFCLRIPLDASPHCPLLDHLRGDLLGALGDVKPQAGAIQIVSGVTGSPISGEQLDAGHWVRNCCEPSFFSTAVNHLIRSGVDVFLDVAPHPVGLSAIEANLHRANAKKKSLVLPSLLRGEDEEQVMRKALRALYLRGALDRTSEPESSRDAASSHDAVRRPLVDGEGPVASLVREHVGAVLERSADDLEVDRPLKELGLNSMLAVRLSHQLSVATGLSLRSTLLFDYPTVRALARFLAAQLGESVLATSTSPRAARRSADDDPIAIISTSCYLPGDVRTPEDLWRLLAEGRDAISAFPKKRGWDLGSLYDPDPDAPGKTYAREGGFLYDADLFDPAFFGISPREALATDPQQRLLLEASWELFERAGIVPRTLEGTHTGVFVGAMGNFYGAGDGPSELEGFREIGSHTSVASGRIAYTFDLRGPTVTLDTACSSSLVAIHLACRSLREGECTLALAGGVSVMVTPNSFISFSRQRALAPDGRCKAFSANADGTAWSEGVGLLLLERLSDAKRHGHPVLAVIRGCAINQDGRSQGLSAPNGPAQERLIKEALDAAGLHARDVDAVDAHGTGTVLGDPIEAYALLATYGQERAPGRPLWLGSLKSNIGHTQAAAGVASVVKIVLAMQHGLLPKTLHADRPSHHVDWSAGAVQLLNRPVPWKKNGTPRRAAISSFGISGTNAHLILEEAPVETSRERPDHGSDHRQADDHDRPAHVLVLSGRTEEALRAQAGRYAAFFTTNAGMSIADACHAAATGRTHFEHRLALVATTTADAAARLEAFSAGSEPEGLVRGHVLERVGHKVAFLFTGQGAQYDGMGRELYASQPVFREALARCAALADAHIERPLLDVLLGADGTTGLVDKTAYTQVALFALEYALTALWRSWGVVPSAVLGHSVGEYVAACVAGVFSLEDAIRLVATRGRLMQALPEDGAMASIDAPIARVRAALDRSGGAVGVAAHNSPMQVVLSGRRQAVQSVCDALEADGFKTRKLAVSHAFHSELMEPMLDEFERAFDGVKLSAPAIPMVTNLGGEVAGGDVTTPAYWRRQAREAVQFFHGVETLVALGVDTFLELGPQPVLIGLGASSVAEGRGLWLGSLRKGRPEWPVMLASLARLFVAGCPVDWLAFDEPYPRTWISLPTYAFQRTRYWLGAKLPGSHGRGKKDAHPLLGEPWSSSVEDGTRYWQSELHSEGALAYLSDHRVAEAVVLPAAAHVEIALAAGREVYGDADVMVEQMVLGHALTIPEQETCTVQVAAVEDESGLMFQLSSRHADGWRRHSTARIRRADLRRPTGEPLESIRARCQLSQVDGATFYAAVEAERAFPYGPAFRGLEKLWLGEGEALADAVLTEAAGDDAGYALHPAFLDSALQALLAILPQFVEPGLMMPIEIQRVRVYERIGTRVWSHARVRGERAAATIASDVRLLDASGNVLAEFEGIVFTRAPEGAFRQVEAQQRADVPPLYALEWRPDSGPPATSAADGLGRWLVLAESELRSRALCEGIASAGGRSMECRMGEGAPGDTTRVIDLSKRSQSEQLVAAATAEGPLAGVVCWWSDDERHRDPAAEAERRAVAALHLIQAIVAAPGGERPRVLWVTEHAQAVRPTERVAVEGAPLWGLGRTIMQEHPELGCHLIDVEAHGAAPSEVLREILHPDQERQIAWRKDVRYVARLVRATAQTAVPARALTGTVLVTGGVGALGLLVSRWLVEARGVRNLVLLGRTAPTGERLVAVDALRATGARVTVAQADVADPVQLGAVLAAIPEDAPLRGVIHAAGSVDVGTLTEQSAESWTSVLAPKVRGAWALHEATRDTPLDFFVLFSSSSALLGWAGHGGYAAANAFLDALAHRRHAEGLTALSVNWGVWSVGGMNDRVAEEDVAKVERIGLRAITGRQGIEMLARALERPEAQLVGLHVDFATMRQAMGHHVPPMWQVLVRAPAADRRQRPAPSVWAGRMATLAPEARAAEIEAAVRTELLRVLALPASSDVPRGRVLRDLGLDSLMAVELRDRLAAQLGQPLPATLAFDYPTIGQIAELLGRKLAPLTTTATTATKATSPDVRRNAIDEPIAIVGIGCRYPGGVTDLESFWRLLDAGVDTVGEMPWMRWGIDDLYNPDPSAAGKVSTRYGAFLDDIARFDARFFGVAAREALSMDPQQRVLLEVTSEALEHAGLRSEDIEGSQTGVFVGLMFHDYASLTVELEHFDGYVMTGSSGCVAAGRVSYLLGLKGPSLAVDTGCSSSLVSLHLACQSLRNGECDRALASGITLYPTPQWLVESSRLRIQSSDGRCKSFDAAADGVGWGEGCGVLVLKRLSDATRDGDRIWGVVHGSAVNQDGRSNGLTAPNGPSQEQVIRRALAQARVKATDVGYVEAHGTGTPLGDTVELQALAAVLADGRTKDAPLIVGSVKSNFGHTGAAAGVGGVIKALLSLHHGVIPKTLHFRNPNPAIAWDEVAITVAEQPIAWSASARPRLAGVSSFGIGGTNAHVLVSAAPPPAVRVNAEVPPQVEDAGVVIPVSGKDIAALRSQCLRYARYLQTHDDALCDVMYTAFARRTHHPHRVAVAGRSREELATKLTALGEQKVIHRAGLTSARRVVFVFPGAGGQWEGMGRELWATEPTFREAVEDCDRVMQRWLDWSVADVLRGEGPKAELSTSDVIQPAVFAFQLGLAALLRAWGIKPAAVVGHSMGELAAAHVAGALSLEDAARIICVRSKVAMTARGLGRMAAVELSEDEARAELRGYEGRVAIGAINGPRAIVLSGERAAIEEVCAKLDARGVFTRWIKVDYASHGPQMDPLRAELLEKLGDVKALPPTVPLYSTVTARRCDETLTAEYWARNLSEPVRFWSAVEALRGDGYDIFLEINAHPILLPAIEEGLGSQTGGTVALASLRRQERARAGLLEAVLALYVAGADVDWARVAPAGRLVPLPAYPFQGERLWPEAPKAARGSRAGADGHALLGPTVALATGGAYVWESEIDLDLEALRYLADHCVEDAVIFPAAAYIEMALAAARVVYGDVPLALEDVTFERVLSLERGQVRNVQLVAHVDGEAMRFTLASRTSGDPWIQHAAGRMVRVSGAADVVQAKSDAPATVRARCGAKVAGSDYYAHVASRGLVYGPAFQGVTAAWSGTDEVLAELQLPAVAGGAGAYGVHPALLDSALHAATPLLPPGREIVVPVAVRRVRILERAVTTGFSHVRASSNVPGTGWMVDVRLLDSAGAVAVAVEGLHLGRAVRHRPVRTEWLLGTTWRLAPLGAHASGSTLAGQRWLVLAGVAGVGVAVVARLEAAGAHVLCLAPKAGVSAVRAAVAGGALAGVVHCWSADEPVEARPDGGLDAAARDGEAALAILQELAIRGARTAPRLWLVTRGARAVDSTGVAAPAGAVLSGLGRTIAQEHGELRCTRVDLDARVDPEIAGAALAAEVLADDPEEEVAYRAGARWVARLVRGAATTPSPPAESPAVIRADATYLITGGLGGLGLAFAGRLVGAGARHLVLVGRRGVTAATQRAAIAALEAEGARVMVAEADVAEYADVERVLALVAAELPPLRGVIHAAAVNEPAMLVDLDGARLARSLRAKAVGAWHLHTLTSGHELDFFVLYSSVASLVGSPGQGNYVAANSYVDALAHHRRALGQVALSINWGSFGDVGSAAETNRDNRLGSRGLHSLTLEEGQAALEWLLGTSAAQVGVVPMDLRRYLEFYPQLMGSPLWSELVASARLGGEESGHQTVRAELTDASPVARRGILERVVRTSGATVLRLDPAELPFDEPLMSLGIDSLMGLELRNRLEAALGLRLSATLIWAYPTISKLVDYLVERIAEILPLPSATTSLTNFANSVVLDEPNSPNVSAEYLERLSVEEKEALLERTLAELEDRPND